MKSPDNIKLKERAYFLVALGLLAALIILTWLQKKAPFWDESYYLENVEILQKQGWSKQFLLNYKGPAGPTFGVVHFFLKPLTELGVPAVRMVNIVFLLATMFMTWLTLKKIGNRDYITATLSILAIPTVYTMAGLVLTEMIAVFFLSVAIYLVLSAYKDNKFNLFNAILAGLCMSAAILGRQPLLLVTLSLPLLLVAIHGKKIELNLSNKKRLIFLLVAIVTSLIIPAWVFSVWGNIQPADVAYTGAGLEPDHLLLAVAYAGLHLVLINPSFFNLKTDFSNLKEVGMVILLAFLANLLLFKVEFTPFNTLASKFLPQQIMPAYALICGSLLAVLGITFSYFFLKKQLATGDSMSLFLTVAFLVVVISSLKVTHQFSARYVAQAFPLLILCVNVNRKEISTGSIISLLIGGLLGLISLNSYFN
jgi:hypothetical protein